MVGIPPGEETVRVVTETVSPAFGCSTRVIVPPAGGDVGGLGAPVAVGALVVAGVVAGAVLVGVLVVGAAGGATAVVVVVDEERFVVRRVVRVSEPNGGEAASCGPLVIAARSSEPDGLALAVDEVRTTTVEEPAARREPLDEHAVSAAAATPAAATTTHRGTSLTSGQPPGDVLPIGCATCIGS